MHNGMVFVGVWKMSKSLGNFLTVDDLLASGPWAAEALCLLLMQTPYRADVDFTDAALLQARSALDRLQRACARLDRAEPLGCRRYPPRRTRRPRYDACGQPQHPPSDRHTSRDRRRSHDGRDGRRPQPPRQPLRSYQALLGILQTDSDAWVKGEDGIDKTGNARTIAARRIRTALAEQRILLEDGPAGTTWPPGLTAG